MKAERAEPKQEFVPVIVTLESQEEVDALFVVCNHAKMTNTLPAINGWWSKLEDFRSFNSRLLWDKFDAAIHE